MLKFSVGLKPKANQSINQGRTRDGRLVFYPKAGVVEFKRRMQWLIKSQLPEGFQLITKGPLVVTVDYRTKMKGVKRDRYKTTRPDIDSNLNKAVFDALGGVVWSDDAIVSRIIATKYCSYEDRIDITINKLEE